MPWPLELPIIEDAVRFPLPLKISLAILWALAIPALSLLPPRFFHALLASSSPTMPGTDKIVHALMYAILTGLMLWAMAKPGQFLRTRAIWDAAVLAALYGALMEALQNWSHNTLHRTADPWDECANILGAVLVAALWLLFRSRRPKDANQKP